MIFRLVAGLEIDLRQQTTRSSSRYYLTPQAACQLHLAASTCPIREDQPAMLERNRVLDPTRDRDRNMRTSSERRCPDGSTFRQANHLACRRTGEPRPALRPSRKPVSVN